MPNDALVLAAAVECPRARKARALRDAIKVAQEAADDYRRSFTHGVDAQAVIEHATDGLMAAVAAADYLVETLE